MRNSNILALRLIVMLCLFWLSACGQKGPLKLPEENTDQARLGLVSKDLDPQNNEIMRLR